METRGAKPKYKTAKELRFVVEKYFANCEEQAVFPD